MENKAVRQYLARIRRALACGRDDRRRLLARCAGMIGVFQQENPEAGYDGLVAAFGEPAVFATELLSSLDESAVEAARKRRRFLRLGALALIVAALAATSVFWYIKYQRSIALDESLYVVEGPVVYMTPEEFAWGMEHTPEESHAHLPEDER